MTDHCTNPNCRHRMPHWHHFAPDPDRPGNVISTTHFPHLIEASRSTSVAEDSTSCVHPADAVWWNEYDRVVRCHRCGEVLTDDLTDDQILDVIATELRKGLYSADEAARDILAVLRDAGYDIVPTDIAKLGRAVRTVDERTGQGYRWWYALNDIYAEAGVDRP